MSTNIFEYYRRIRVYLPHANRDSQQKSKRTQERTEITRQKLLDAATGLFAYRGFDGVTIRDIEKSADVHRGLATYHFDDKESLWRAVADASFNQMRGQIEQRLGILREPVPG